MRRSVLYMIGIAIVLCLYNTTAMMMQENGKQLQEKINADEQAAVAETMPQNYINGGNRHKLFLSRNDEAAYSELLSRNAIIEEIDYGSFKMVVVDERALGGRSALEALPVVVQDEQNMISLNGYILDTTNPEVTYRQLPSDLRRTDMARAMTEKVAPSAGLYLVQFAGPIQDSWLSVLKDLGAQIITYIPSNAYIVRADYGVAGALPSLLGQYKFVQFVGDYEPAFRITPELRSMRRLPSGTAVDVTVQVIDGPDAEATIAALRAISLESGQSQRVLSYRNVALKVDVARLVEIASMENVFGVEERTPRRKMDEAQGQILAGNISGNKAVLGSGYLAWLASKGFNNTQFGSFAVNVNDDATSLTGHPDLPSTRIVFQNNPTNQTGVQGGHGFLNSHIIGGFNSGNGAENEDSRGFNYGLGIAPFARIGITAIFGSGSATPTSWESTAYGRGARISSNSWGFTGTAAKRYDVNAQEFDRIVRDAQTATAGLQQLTVVFAAGNDGSGANTVSSPATAKNIICVGAGENDRATGTDGCAVTNTGADSANDIINFSSRGPVNSTGGDGRIKPDIMAPGTHIEAGIPQSNYDGSSVCNQFFPAGQTLYGWSSGTSHSCPAVAGGATLLYQDFLNHGLGAPSPAMVKGYLMNSATYMTGTGANDTLPSNNQGMGRMNLGRAFDGVSRILVDQTQTFANTGETFTQSGSVVDSTQPFRVTLAWTDAPGPTTGAPWVNNLDLEVTINGTTFKGNVFSGQNSVAGGTADIKNNVESVFLPAGTTGSFTITVRATNIAGDGVPGNADTTDQDFALVVYNATAGAPQPPTIGVSPTSFSFTATAGGANPANQTLNISNTGGGTLTYSLSDDAPWLTLSPTSGTAPSSSTLSVNTSGLAAGTYNGTITVSATGATNTPVTIPVTLTVNAAPSPTIGVSPTSFSFSATAGGANPSAQTLSISNTGGGTLSFTTSTNQPWLSASPASGTAPASVSVSVNITGLAAGTYNGAVTVSATGATNTPVTVPVTLTVNPQATPPTIGVSPTSFSFSATAGGANPANQTLNITNTGGGTLTYSLSDNAPWLTLSPTSGTAPSSSTLSVNISGLAAGTFNGTITVSATGATNTPVTIPVTLTVNAAQVPPTIGVSPTSFSFTATAGGANPASQTLNITNTGGGLLSYSLSDNATWLTLNPTSGTAPSSSTLSVNISGLAAGTYNGTITVTAIGATNTPLTIPVTLTVNPAGGGSSELITNGGFETSASPWVLSGTGAAYANTTAGTGSFPHTGQGYLFFGNADSVTGQAYQQVTVPSNATSANLSFWLNITSAETTTITQFDRLFVEVRNTAGTLLATLATYSNLNKDAVAGSYNLKGNFSLLNFRGQTVRVQFRCTTDSIDVTTFRVDDVSLLTSSVAGADLIANGGFETSASPWLLSGTGVAYGNVSAGTGDFPHTGEGYLFFGNANSVTGQAYQQITIPSTATSANLSFWLNVTSAETTTISQFDRLFVEVRNTSGTLLATLATFSNLNKNSTAGSYTQRGNFSLLSFKGQTIRVQFRATTDSTLTTTFRVDDVSVK